MQNKCYNLLTKHFTRDRETVYYDKFTLLDLFVCNAMQCPARMTSWMCVYYIILYFWYMKRTNKQTNIQKTTNNNKSRHNSLIVFQSTNALSPSLPPSLTSSINFSFSLWLLFWTYHGHPTPHLHIWHTLNRVQIDSVGWIQNQSLFRLG